VKYALLLLLSSCISTGQNPPYDAFLPVHFVSLPDDPYDAGYACRFVEHWQWPEMECREMASKSKEDGQ